MAIRPEMLVEKFCEEGIKFGCRAIDFFKDYSRDEILSMFNGNNELNVKYDGNEYKLKLIDGETVGISPAFLTKPLYLKALVSKFPSKKVMKKL